MSAAENIQTQPVEQTDAVVIQLFPGATVEVSDDHWSRTLPRRPYGDSEAVALIKIYATVGAAVATGLAIRALNGGAL